MIVRICIHVPDMKPNAPEAWDTTDIIESHLYGKLNSLMEKIDPAYDTSSESAHAFWWIDVLNGETRYAPKNLPENA